MPSWFTNDDPRISYISDDSPSTADRGRWSVGTVGKCRTLYDHTERHMEVRPYLFEPLDGKLIIADLTAVEPGILAGMAATSFAISPGTSRMISSCTVPII